MGNILIRKMGRYGAAYDGPEERRAYSYKDQPDDLNAHRIGKAVWATFERHQHKPNTDLCFALLLELEGLGFGVFELGEDEMKQNQELNDFFARYNSAINNPAPDDDGGTTSYEYEKLLDEAVLLLEKLA